MIMSGYTGVTDVGHAGAGVDSTLLFTPPIFTAKYGCTVLMTKLLSDRCALLAADAGQNGSSKITDDLRKMI